MLSQSSLLGTFTNAQIIEQKELALVGFELMSPAWTVAVQTTYTKTQNNYVKSITGHIKLKKGNLKKNRDYNKSS